MPYLGVIDGCVAQSGGGGGHEDFRLLKERPGWGLLVGLGWFVAFFFIPSPLKRSRLMSNEVVMRDISYLFHLHLGS